MASNVITLRLLALIIGQGASRIGDSIHLLALSVWVVQSSSGGSRLATALNCNYIPMLAAMGLGALVLDALPRRGVLVGADLVRGVVAVLLAFVFFTNGTTIGAVTISPWIALCVGGAIFGAADGLFIPTVLAAVPDLVPEKDIA